MLAKWRVQHWCCDVVVVAVVGEVGRAEVVGVTGEAECEVQ